MGLETGPLQLGKMHKHVFPVLPQCLRHPHLRLQKKKKLLVLSSIRNGAKGDRRRVVPLVKEKEKDVVGIEHAPFAEAASRPVMRHRHRRLRLRLR